MMTSRAEYRLLLRQDNADLRLTAIGHEIGLISDERYQKLNDKKRQIDEEIKRLKTATIGTTPQVQAFLEQHNSTLLKSGMTLEELLKRPEICYNDLKEIDTKQPELPEAVTQQVEISIKYEGYIKRQLQQVEQFKKLEKKKLSLDFDYSQVPNLRKEAIQKLNEYQPASIGQASRISGVSPADVSVLLVYLNR